jgi:hypothetical protein
MLPNSATICSNLRNGARAGFWHKKHLDLGSVLTEVRFGEQVQQAIGEKLLGSVVFLVFGKTKCKKSLARGFWTFWSH